MRTQEIVEAYGKTHIYMIGMDDNPQPKHIEVIIKNVKHDNIFSGGKRHYEIVKPFLPADAVWIEIKAPINAVLAEYSRLIQEGKVIVSFVSGDPFFSASLPPSGKPFRSRHESVSLLQLIADVRTP